MTNVVEAALGTDPWESDTDRDGLGDATDPDPLNRAVMSWGSPLHTDGDEYVYVGPSWWVGAWKEGGSWSTNPPGWHAAGDDSLYIAIDRAQLTNNAILEVEYAGSTNPAFYVDLCDTNAQAVSGPIGEPTGLPTGMRVRTNFAVPLTAHPEAVLLRLRRGAGELWIYGSLLHAPEAESPTEALGQLGLADSGSLQDSLGAPSGTPGTAGPVLNETAAPTDPSLAATGDPTSVILGGGTNSLPAEPAVHLATVIFVDARHGRDDYSGRAPMAVNATLGPKQTVRAGLAATGPCDTLIIREGCYRESLSVAARDVAVCIQGHVDISGTVRATGETAPHDSASPTNHAAWVGGAAGETYETLAP